jgi:uncharacterized OsmC-like protein
MTEADPATGLLPPSIAETDRPTWIRPAVRARNPASLRTEIRIRQHDLVSDEAEHKGGTDSGPTPLETALASLAACEAVIIRVVATALGFAYRGVDIACEGVADLRGARGVAGIRPHFQSVRLVITLDTEEPERRIALLRRNVEQRCPVLNLFIAAGVAVELDWRTATEGTSP